MIFKIKLSKKVLFRLAVVAVLAGAAFFFDSYFENNPEKIEQLSSSQNKDDNSQGGFDYNELVSLINVNQVIQKAPFRFVQSKIHDKFLQKFHQLRIFHSIKSVSVKQKVPPDLCMHFLVFRNYNASLPDDEPLIL